MEARTFILFDDLLEPPPPTSRVPALHLAHLVAQTLPPPRPRPDEIIELSPDDVILEEDDDLAIDVDDAW